MRVLLKLILSITLLPVLSPSVASTQSLTKDTVVHTVHTESSSFTFYVDHMPAGLHWIITINPDDKPGTVDVKAQAIAPIGLSGVFSIDQAIQPISESLYLLNGSNFHLDASTLDRSVFVTADVSVGQNVLVEENGKKIFNGVVHDGQLIVDGKLASKHGDVESAAVGMLLFPNKIVDEFGQGIHTGKNGEWAVTPAELRKHVVSVPSISGPFTNQAFDDGGGNAEAVFIGVTIGLDGHVSSMTTEKGSGPLLTAARAALSAARFTPFLVNGTAVEVHGHVQVTLFRNQTNGVQISLLQR
jgi:hypothetical protein